MVSKSSCRIQAIRKIETVKNMNIKRKLKYKIITILSIAILCSSCVGNKAQEQQIYDLTYKVQSLQNDIDDMAYQINSHNVELEILEGKASGQKNLLSNIEKNVGKTIKQEKSSSKNNLLLLEQQLAYLEKTNKTILIDIRNIQNHYNTSSKIISGQSSRLKSLEQESAQQTNKTNKILASIGIINSIVSDNNDLQSTPYKVSTGDSLEKIAKKFKTSVSSIKEINSLNSDLIIVGQTLKVPAKG